MLKFRIQLLKKANNKKINNLLHSNKPIHLQRQLATTAGYEVNKVIHGFSVQEVRDIEELNLTGIKLKHLKTGAQHLHIVKQDTNNVFGIGFQTIPTDSAGVPHILEHTTLCGSEKYPVRDPFFKMLNRSLATYMNAWTAQDFTNYPFSTQNPTDYKNLMQVYLDATLCPRLLETDFKQEGWRLENEDPNDLTSPLIFKGVVFNEMKGAFSDVGALFYYRHQQSLFENTKYQNLSGGDPSVIPNLTYHDLKQFHTKNYLPENAKSFSYGSFPVEDHLDALNQKYLQVIGNRELITPEVLNDQDITPKWNGTKRVTIDGPFDPMSPPDRQHKITVTYLTNQSTDLFETLSLNLLSNLLVNGASAPLQQALLDTNLGADYSPTTGYASHLKQASFSVGLQGVQESDLKKIEDTIQNVLEEVSRTGFSDQLIESTLQPIELAYKHRTSNFGMNIMQGLMTSWMYGNNPLDSLQVTKSLERLRSEISKGKFFENLITKYLLHNPNKMVFIMQPNHNYQTQLEHQEQQLLTETKSKLADTQQKKEQIFENGKLLLEHQNRQEDVSCLPTLGLNDITKDVLWHEIYNRPIDNVPVYWRATDSNQISYFKMVNQINHLPDRLRPYLPLFCDALTYLGTKRRSMADIEQDIGLHTGGIGFSPYVQNSLQDIQLSTEGITTSAHCLDSKIPELYRLVQELILETDFDNLERLKTLILNNASSLNGDVASSGHAYARKHAASSLSRPMTLSETLSGLSQVSFMSQLAEKSDDLSQTVQNLKEIQKLVLIRNSVKAFVISEPKSQDLHLQPLSRFLQSLPVVDDINIKTQPSQFVIEAKNILYKFPFSTNYTGLVYNALPYHHPDNPYFQILSSLLTHNYLHQVVREKGGAYGGGANFNPLSGQFSFYSYRDPNPFPNVLKTYHQSLEWGANHEFTERQLMEAKLSLFQGLDRPTAASEEGSAQFTFGLTKESIQQRREKYLGANLEHIQNAAQFLLENPTHSQTVVGDSQLPNEASYFEIMEDHLKSKH